MEGYSNNNHVVHSTLYGPLIPGPRTAPRLGPRLKIFCFLSAGVAI